MGSELDATQRMYRRVLAALCDEDIPVMVGGAYALGIHTGIHRETKDLDLFVLPAKCQAVLDLLVRLGYPARLVARHWLGKVSSDAGIIDVIFGFRNGVGLVEERWFEHAREAVLLGMPVKILAVEEMIWSKAFVMERDRYDGADIAHLIWARAKEMDWSRLLDRFGSFWMVLLTHLALFNFIYPHDRKCIPRWLVRELTERWLREGPSSNASVCQGTLLSFTQYEYDLNQLGLLDARLQPIGRLTPENILE